MVLLLSQQVTVICLALMQLVHALEQLLLLGLVLMQLWELWKVRRDVGRTNRRGARPGYGGVGRIPEGMRNMTRERVARRRGLSGVSQHEVNGLLLVRPYLPQTPSAPSSTCH